MPTNLYGPGDNYHELNSHVFASFIRKFYQAKKDSISSVTCWGTGKPLREFMHVHDLGDAVIFALEHWNPLSKDAPFDQSGKPLSYLNVGTGKDISIKELATLIAKAVNFKGEVLWDKSKPDGTFRKNLCIKKIKNLGWAPKIGIKDGILKTLETFKKELIEGSIKS